MFRRVFWFGAGAAAGVWATTKVQRRIRALSPESLAARAAGKAVEGGQRVREFALDVRTAMAQRESELHDALGLLADPDGPAAGPAPLGAPAPRGELGATAPGSDDGHR